VGRCRYFASVSVFGFLVGFYKSRFGIRYRFLKISDIGSVFGYPTYVYNYIPLIPRSSITTVYRPKTPDNENAFHNYRQLITILYIYTNILFI